MPLSEACQYLTQYSVKLNESSLSVKGHTSVVLDDPKTLQLALFAIIKYEILRCDFIGMSGRRSERKNE